MTPEEQASQLARWLSDQPGSEPPADLDAEVVEAVYALRPDLAPAPRVSIDDILAGVTAGPFAPAGANTPAPPLPEPPAEVVDLAAARRRRSRGIWGGLGTLAAAALVLMVVMPAKEEAPGGAPLPITTDAPADALSDDLPQQDARPEATEQELWDPGPAGEPTSAPEGEAAPPPRTPSTPDMSERISQTVRPEPTPSAGATAGGGLVAGPYDRLDLGGERREADAPQARPVEEPAPLTEVTAAEVASAPAPQQATQAKSVSSASSSRSYDAYDDLDEMAAEDQRGGRARDASRRPPRRQTSGNIDTPAEPDDAVADGWIEESDEAGVAQAPMPTDLPGLRAAAFPGDYRSTWYVGTAYEAEVAPILAEAVAAGGPAASARVCAAHINDDPLIVGQDMAARAAGYALAAGDPTAALQHVRAGKGRSSANSAFLARLYALEGQALEASGDIEGALNAYRTAATLNRAR
ncbi:MAG: hypothetical protein H6739_21495 [Alphaproteobacteria bacterium]|nr:hypothetical protein [Alphaproteobacteria bacterium]